MIHNSERMVKEAVVLFEFQLFSQMVIPVSGHWEGQVLTLNQVMNTKFCFESCAGREILWSPMCRKTRKILGRMITDCNDVICNQAAYGMSHCRLLGNSNELNSTGRGHKCSEI